MRVKNILEAKGSRVETMETGSPVPNVIHRLTSRGIGAVVISDNGRTIDGIISERDIVQGLDRFGAKLADAQARDIMSIAATCSPDDDVVVAMSKMTRSRNRHLPVVRDGILCGIISIGDLVKRRLEELELQNNVLTDNYIAGRVARP